MSVGLRDIKKQALSEWAENIDAIKAVWLFGSRARGDHRADSDFDIALELMPMRGLDDWSFTAYFFNIRRWKREVVQILNSRTSIVCWRADMVHKFDPRIYLVWQRD